MGLTKPRAHQLQDIDYKQTARALTDTNITLSGGAPATVDGVSLALHDRVLVTGQTDASENGIYYVTTVGAGSNGTWARSLDANETGELNGGTIIMVTEGTNHADTQWKLTTDDPITIGSTNLNFALNSSAAYGVIAVAGQSSISANSVGDTLTVATGNNIVVTTNAGTETLTIAANDTPSFDSVTVTGNASANNISVTNFVNSNLIPSANITYNLGSDTARWNELFLAGNTIHIGSLQLKDESGVLGIFAADGTTPATIDQSSIDTTQIANGTSLLKVVASNSNIVANIGGSTVSTFTSGGIEITGNITVTGTVDGRDVAADGALAASAVQPGDNVSDLTNDANYIDLTDISVTTNTASGDGSLSYNNTTGVFTFTPADAGLADYGDSNVATFLGSNFGSNVIVTTGNITAGNVIATIVGDVTGNITGSAATATSATTAGTVTTAAQPNITSVGTLSSVTVTGNVSAGNVDGTRANFTNLVGTLETSTQTNITSVGTLGSLNVTGNVDAGNVNATIVGDVTGNVSGTAATVTTAAQPNITSVGTLDSVTVSGNAIVGGDLTVSGNTVYTNVTTFSVQDPIIDLGRGANGTPLGSDDGKDRGTQLYYYSGSEKSAFVGYDNSEGKIVLAKDVSISSEVVTVSSYGNVVVGGLEAATASVTGNVDAGNVNATSISGTLITAAQTNITSVGTLSSLSVTGNITVSGLVDGRDVAADGALAASAVQPGDNVSDLTNDASYIDLTDISVNTAAASGDGSLSYNNTTGVFTFTPADAGLSDYGDSNVATFLSSNFGSNTIVTTGNITAGNVIATIVGDVTGNITGSAATATSATTAGTVTTAAQPNITSVGTLTSVSVTGNVDAGNVNATIVGDVTGEVTGNVSGSAATAGTVTTAAQPNITSVGTLTSITTSGNITATGNININDRQGLYLYDSDSSNYIAIVSPSTVSGNVTFTLPGDAGTADYVLATNGAGTLSWIEQSSGGGSGASSFPNSTVTPLPGSEGNFDLSYNYAQTTQETPFETGGTDAFGVSLGEVYSMMDPAGDIPTPTDLGVLT
jgi:hypothetical protein